MLKTNEFARQCGVSNRHITRLIKRHESDLAGHFERRNAGGTWIDETAQDFIRSKLRNPRMILPAEEGEEPDPRKLQQQVQGLLIEVGMLGKQLADAERRAGANAQAAALLEASDAEKQRLQDERDRLIEEKAAAEQKAEAEISAAHQRFQQDLKRRDEEHAKKIGEERELREITEGNLKNAQDELARIRSSRFYKIFKRFIER